MKLIYRDTNSSIPFSPYDEEILRLAREQDLLLVSPYNSITYLERLSEVSTSWKLITDLQEWILSYAKEDRILLCDFINRHSENIRDIKNIHAKVLITASSAFLGSANFTKKAMQERTEMCVSFDDLEKVMELRRWFNSLWKTAQIFSQEQLIEFVDKNVGVAVQSAVFNLKRRSIKEKKLVLLSLDQNSELVKKQESDLINAIKNLNQSKEWVNNYFCLLEDMFLEFAISNDLQIITMSVRKDLSMPVTVGQRYIASPYQNDQIGLILPLGFDDISYRYDKVYEGHFTKNKVNEAKWIKFNSDTIFLDNNLSSELIDYWKEAVKTEIGRTKKSGYRKHHNPCYYKAVMDLSYRKMVLKLTFQKF